MELLPRKFLPRKIATKCLIAYFFPMTVLPLVKQNELETKSHQNSHSAPVLCS